MLHHRLAAAPRRGTEIAALSCPEQLLLWAMRKWRADREGWATAGGAFRRACGPGMGPLAHSWLDCVLTLLARSGRRSIRVNPLTARDVSPDEAAILSLIAAAQWNDRHHAEAQADLLVPIAARAPLLESAAIIGAALELAEHGLPPRHARRRPGDAVN